ncbi:S-(hydroxymethyl)glutathione dehydrogenase / alcohol dehydrogenase [Pseudonocardia thermophila]|uniref:S-(Hydroxymethyl)glutathione dehydrogenase / alcohol dehydrogenase n=1 Tax=Pseudonocardia thermophila TaxID=1848 RepID=A0A1M6WRI6_PSETH|nr:alcohol dehydrogenase catalytic domain-containing protein [Pseudonocardia thermophila]SHK96254.1 S-(hydroxymethyl)glutathione dehydrogenase / alcohol dehydrogenase [Pseudonocardia thermophila]
MRAAILAGYGEPLRVTELDIDKPLDDEVLVEVRASGVCHSDLTAARGGQQPGLPVVLGHEVAGEVLEVGRGVTGVRPGDRVVVTGTMFCGSCRWCVGGHPQHCRNKPRSRPRDLPPRLSLEGRPVQAYVGVGGFAEQVLVHSSGVARIGDRLSFATACLLGCAVVTGMGAVINTARVRAGESVVVVGCGGVGLSAVAAARLSGASPIVAVDVDPAKLSIASRFGATHGVLAGDDAAAEVVELTGGGADHVIEAVGSPATVRGGFAMLGVRGTLTSVGMARMGADVTLPLEPLMMSERRVQGSKMGGGQFARDVANYERLCVEGRLDLDALVSHTVPLDEVNAAFDVMDRASYARTVITFD